MKKHEITKLNSGHQKFLKAVWERKLEKKAEIKDSKLERQTNQTEPTAAVDTIESNLKKPR